jgi:uncharacterized protein (TIGR03000 family)
MSAKRATAGPVALVCLVALLGGRAAAQANPLSASVEVRLPAGAELWFDGVAAPQTAERRAFTTPPLQPGLTYRYEVQVRWREGGRDVVRGEHVTVRAGEAVVVDFTRPREGQGGPDHMAVRDVARPAPPARVVAAAHDSLVELPGGPAASRRLPGYMAVMEFDPTVSNGATRPAAMPGYMSILEFDTLRH